MVRGVSSCLHDSVLFFILVCFMLLRVPYLYGMLGFARFLFLFVFPLFLSLFFSRFFFKVSEFFSGFVPRGTPL